MFEKKIGKEVGGEMGLGVMGFKEGENFKERIVRMYVNASMGRTSKVGKRC